MYFKVKHLACVKGERYLFGNLSFSLSSGELLWIKGRNGAGKTSLLRMLAGLYSPDRGSIESTVTKAYVGHQDGLKRGLSVLDNINYATLLAGKKSEHSEIMPLLDHFTLKNKQHALCSVLSLGQRRKVALISLMLKQKTLWIIDEPFTGLDKESAKQIGEAIANHLKQGGMAIVASHTGENLMAHQTVELSGC